MPPELTGHSTTAYDIVVMAASKGGIKTVTKVLSSLPRDFPVPVVIVLHRGTRLPNYQAHVLGRATLLPVKIVTGPEALRPAAVFLAPPHMHLRVSKDRGLALSDGHKIRHQRSSANPLFESAAEAFGPRVVAVVLTGGDRDATDGVQTVREHGGMVIVQDEATSEDFSMPKSAIETGCVNWMLPVEQIGPAVKRLVLHGPLRRGHGERHAAEEASGVNECP